MKQKQLDWLLPYLSCYSPQAVNRPRIMCLLHLKVIYFILHAHIDCDCYIYNVYIHFTSYKILMKCMKSNTLSTAFLLIKM